MINIDMWYGDDHKQADKSTLLFIQMKESTEETYIKMENTSVIMFVPIVWSWKRVFHNQSLIGIEHNKIVF